MSFESLCPFKKPSDETGSSGGFAFPGNSMEERQDAALVIVM